MPVTRQEALKLIYTSLAEINASRGSDSRVRLKPETKLLGSSGELDSLEFVNFIVGLEEQLAKRLEHPVVLVNEDAIAEARFRDVAALAKYIADIGSTGRL